MEGVTTVGSGDGSDIRLDGEEMLPRHAIIIHQQGDQVSPDANCNILRHVENSRGYAYCGGGECGAASEIASTFRRKLPNLMDSKFPRPT